MKKVELGKIVEVPASYQKCIVCKKYHPRESFTNPAPRTNCLECYHMNYDDMIALKKKTDEIEKEEPSQEVLELRERNRYLSFGMTKKALMEHLSDLPDDAIVVMTQEGNYADGKLADIHAPEKEDTRHGTVVYSIGHSQQGV